MNFIVLIALLILSKFHSSGLENGIIFRKYSPTTIFIVITSIHHDSRDHNVSTVSPSGNRTQAEWLYETISSIPESTGKTSEEQSPRRIPDKMQTRRDNSQIPKISHSNKWLL